MDWLIFIYKSLEKLTAGNFYKHVLLGNWNICLQTINEDLLRILRLWGWNWNDSWSLPTNLYIRTCTKWWFSVCELGNIPILWQKHVGNCKVFHGFPTPYTVSRCLFPPSLEPHHPSVGATYCCFSSSSPRRHWWPERSKHHRHDAVQRTWSQSPQTTSIPPYFRQIRPAEIGWSDCFSVFGAGVKL